MVLLMMAKPSHQRPSLDNTSIRDPYLSRVAEIGSPAIACYLVAVSVATSAIDIFSRVSDTDSRCQ